MPSYHASATTTALPEVVWRLLVDGRAWPCWPSGLDELIEERSSGLDPHGHDGVGAVRAFRTGRVVTGERLTQLVPERRLAYEDASNFALRDYQAVIDLEPTALGGTNIERCGTWRVRPGIGWVMPFVLPAVMQRMANDFADHARRQ